MHAPRLRQEFKELLLLQKKEVRVRISTCMHIKNCACDRDVKKFWRPRTIAFGRVLVLHK